MDDSLTPAADEVTDELGHITEEIYRKNVALAQSNKTLSLLRKLDEIILSTLTDPKGVAQEVVDITAQEAGYKGVAILLKNADRNSLDLLGISQTEGIKQIQETFKMNLFSEQLSLDTSENSIVKAFNEKVVQVTHEMYAILGPSVSENQAKQIQEMLSIITIIVYPLIVRGKSIGALIMMLDLDENNLSGYQHDLRERLPDVIGVAMDNALLYQEIESANKKLQALDKLKDEFVSLASHELRTPMTAIKSYLWMALAGKGGPLSEKQKYYLDRAYSSTDRLIKLVNEMLNVSRIESGRILLSQKEVDLNTLSDDILADVMPRATELGIGLVVEHDTTLSHVFADSDKLKEVFINLIGNSLKFTPKDGKISISFHQTEHTVEVSVSDTGKGIAQDDIPKLFQKFGKVDNNYLTAQNVQGTGLGLYITKAIIQLHGGDIWVRSEGLGKGTTFTFSLPHFTGQAATSSTEESGKEIVHTTI